MVSPASWTGTPLRMIIPVKYGVKSFKRIGNNYFDNEDLLITGLKEAMIIAPVYDFPPYHTTGLNSYSRKKRLPLFH